MPSEFVLNLDLANVYRTASGRKLAEDWITPIGLNEAYAFRMEPATAPGEPDRVVPVPVVQA
jgi:hypothetical protein